MEVRPIIPSKRGRGCFICGNPAMMVRDWGSICLKCHLSKDEELKKKIRERIDEFNKFQEDCKHKNTIKKPVRMEDIIDSSDGVLPDEIMWHEIACVRCNKVLKSVDLDGKEMEKHEELELEG